MDEFVREVLPDTSGVCPFSERQGHRTTQTVSHCLSVLEFAAGKDQASDHDLALLLAAILQRRPGVRKLLFEDCPRERAVLNRLANASLKTKSC